MYMGNNSGSVGGGEEQINLHIKVKLQVSWAS